MTELARPYIHDGRHQMVRRPAEHDLQRIVCYRTMVCMGYNEAFDADAPREVLDYLAAEHEWACARMAAGGITPPGWAPVESKGQMEMFG